MARCVRCKKTINPGERYCPTCLNDSTPLRSPSIEKLSPPRRSNAAKIVLLIAIVFAVGIAFDALSSGGSSDDEPSQSSSAVKLERAKRFLRMGDGGLAIDDLRSIPQGDPAYSEAQSLIPEALRMQRESQARRSAEEVVPRQQTKEVPRGNQDRIVELIGIALNEQYDKQTPYLVHVHGEDRTKTLYFDCSDDPHPKEVCLILYKLYPNDSEARVLRLSGVRRLVFSVGGLTQWTKTP